MRYKSIILILFCFNVSSSAQNQTEQAIDLKIKKKVLKIYRKKDIEDCEIGIQLAIKDYYNGVRHVYYWGDGACEDSICIFFKQILKLENGFSFTHVGCSPFEREMCYTEWMERKLILVHGKDFFDKIWKRAAQLTQKY